MDHMLLEAKYAHPFKLDKETLDYCKQFKVLALYASIQFIHSLEPVLKQLEEIGVKVITSTPDRTNAQYQILGCDAFHSTLKLPEEPDAFLYVGDGVFHPRALVLAQKDRNDFKMVIRYDPLQDKMILMDKDDCKKIFQKYKAGLIKFLQAQNIGIIITVKPGQQQFLFSQKLAVKYPDKKVYYFAENTLDYTHMEDFNFISVWVNSSCPRVGFDDIVNMPVSMINITDALNAEEILGKDSMLTNN